MDQPAKILVVEDEPATQKFLKLMLEACGHQVDLACDGLEALDKVNSQTDLVLMDVMMPRMAGHEVLERLKADEVLRHIPVVMVSAMDEMDNVLRAISLGAEDYLPKPFDIVLLKARIGACLEKKRLRDREQAFTAQLQSFNEQLEKRVLEATEEINEKNRHLERRVRELGAVINVSRSIISVLNVDTLLQQIMELSKDVMNAEASSLLMWDPSIHKLRFHVAQGTAGDALKSATVELGHGIAGWVAQTGEPLLIPDAYNDPRFNPDFDKKTGFHTRSILTVPVKSKDAVIGVVQVINKRGAESFDQHDQNLFQSFASLAGIALENARLFEQTKSMAEDLRDALEQERRLSIEKEKMGAYIPKHVVDEISRSREQKLALGGKTILATILFSDIQGFTRLAENMAPEEVVGFLNEYMTAMAIIIDEEQGILDKFIGDGIMAVYLPQDDERDHHAARAVRSGIRMQLEIQKLKQNWTQTRPLIKDIKVRVGINTGEVVSGNIGSQTRMDYTVIGDNVNVASRIESNGRPGEVFISETTYEYVKDFVAATKMEPISVKNRIRPVQTYSVQMPTPARE